MPDELARRIATLRAHFGKDYELPEDCDESDLLYMFGKEPDALLYAALFVPEFLEVDGEVYLREMGLRIQQRTDDLALRMQAAKAESAERFDYAVESCNWVEVPYIFSSSVDDDYRDEGSELLAALVAEAWSARLRYLYPKRRFFVRVIDPEETGSVVGVGFKEDKAASKQA